MFHPCRSFRKLYQLLAHLSWEHNIFPAIELAYKRRNREDMMRSRCSRQGVLSVEQEREIDAFFAPYCGRVSHWMHHFYTEKTGVFSIKYIPDNIHYLYIDRFYNDWRLAAKLDNKCLLAKYFPDTPMPEHVSYRVNGYWQDAGYHLVDKRQAYQAIIKAGPVVLKAAVDSFGGRGIAFFDGSQQTEAELDEIIKNYPSDIVVQKVVRQSRALAQIHPSSLNTVRLMTFLKPDGSVKVCSVVLRMGRSGSRVDNASSGGIVAGVAPDGRLKDCAYTKYGAKFEHEHPDTHVPFHDIVIPHYAELLAQVSRLHQSFPLFRLLSWDMAYNENDNPLMIEVNMCYGELDFHQLTNGPVFGDDTEAILAEVFQKR